MKKNFQIFWIKFKKFIENPFYWNVAAALFSITLAGCFIWEGKDLLAIIWAICSGCQIASAWMNRNLR